MGQVNLCCLSSVIIKKYIYLTPPETLVCLSNSNSSSFSTGDSRKLYVVGGTAGTEAIGLMKRAFTAEPASLLVLAS